MTAIDTSTEAPTQLTEHDEALARVRALEEITDPDFIWGAMDNVHDMDVTLDDYAKAVSRAQRAALAASQPADPVTNAGSCQPVKVKPLVWEDAEPFFKDEPDSVFFSEGKWAGGSYFAEIMEPDDTLSDLKARHEENHRAIILSAIDPAPVTPAEAAKVQALVACAGAVLALDKDIGTRSTVHDMLEAALAKIKGANHE